MLYLIALLAGALIAIMIQLNGTMTAMYGLYTATFIAHFVALIASIVIAAIKKQKIFNFKKVPLWLYLGGAIGVATVIFNNMAVGYISMSAILAISLFGQAITSLFIDGFGLFGMPKRGFKLYKIIGLSVVFIGIVIMLIPFDFNAGSIIAIIVSLLTGFTVNSSRAISTNLGEKTGTASATVIYYAMGAILSLVIMIIFGWINQEVLFVGKFEFSPKVWIYLGGFLGALTLVMTNAIFNKIDTLYSTLLIFVGQVFAGIVIDAILSTVFSLPLLIGAVLSLAGLIINLLLDRYKEKKEKEVTS